MEKLKARGENTIMSCYARRFCAAFFVGAHLSVGFFAPTPIKAATNDVYTDPVGFVTMTVLGTNNAPYTAPYETHLAMGMTQLPVSRGKATAVAANKVGVNDTLTNGLFNLLIDNGGTHTNPAYFVELTSGSMAGVIDDIVSNDTANVYTADDLTSAIGAGCTYKIYPHWTISRVFGTNNQAGLQGGISSTADLVQFWNPVLQSYSPIYYYKTSGGGGTGWRAFGSSSVNTSNDVVYIDSGVTITHTGTNLNIQVVGGVKLGPTMAVILANGETHIGIPYPAGYVLSQTGLYTTNSATGLQGGITSTADTIQIWNPTLQSYGPIYYYKTSGGGGTGWRAFGSSSVDVSTNVIPMGSVMTIVRQPGNPTFNWTLPQPFVNQ